MGGLATNQDLLNIQKNLSNMIINMNDNLFSKIDTIDNCVSNQTCLELVNYIDHVKGQKDAGLEVFNGVQGLDFSEDGKTAYLTCVLHSSIMEVDLETGKTIPHILTDPDNSALLLNPDDIVRVGNKLYFEALVILDTETGGYLNYSAVYSLEIDNNNPWKSVRLWQSKPGEVFVNPIAHADGFLYTATALGIKVNQFGIATGPPDADGNLTLLDETTTPHYPRKIWKLTMTGEVVWEKEYDLYVNAFDIRDGFIYAPAQDLGGHRDAAWAFQSTEFHIVRVNIENGEMEKLVSFPKLPQNAYPVACKFMGNKLFCHTDRIWVFDYDTTLKNINKESMRLAYDFDIHRPQIQMTTFYAYVNGQYVEADHQQKYTLADNGKAHPDGVHYYISGQNKLFKMKLRDENRKPIPVLN